jgi:hypothetical protein
MIDAMPRPSLLLSVRSLLLPLLTAALLTLPPEVAAAARQAEPAVDFELKANHGMHAHVISEGDFIALEISRGARTATYKVEGEGTETGLKAKFGGLGEIDVAFDATETNPVKPPHGCHGPPSTDSRGVFTGTIEFTGERDYVRVDASEAKGTLRLDREGEWRCPITRGRQASQKKEEPGFLFASDARCHCLFAAFSLENGRRLFAGGRVEDRGKMQISRVTAAAGGPSTFVYDLGAGTARANPPRPFTGTATFKRRPHRPALWRSSIRVPLLGASPVHLGGPHFRAVLTKDLFGG